MRGLWARMRGTPTPADDKWDTARQIYAAIRGHVPNDMASAPAVYVVLEANGYYWDGEDWVRRASDE